MLPIPKLHPTVRNTPDSNTSTQCDIKISSSPAGCFEQPKSGRFIISTSAHGLREDMGAHLSRHNSEMAWSSKNFPAWGLSNPPSSEREREEPSARPPRPMVGGSCYYWATNVPIWKPNCMAVASRHLGRQWPRGTGRRPHLRSQRKMGNLWDVIFLRNNTNNFKFS